MVHQPEVTVAGVTALDTFVVRQLMGRHGDPLVVLTEREREDLP